MSFKKLIVAAAVAAAAFAGSAQAAEKVRIGTEGAYPPFNTIDAQGQVGGFDVDIAKALCEKMKVECQIVTQDWDGIIPALKAKKFDAIVASMSITDERKKAVDFTEPYYSNKLQFVAKKGSAIDGTVDGLKGKAVGAQRATIAGEWLEKNAKGADVKLYDTQENAWLDLAAGRLEAMMVDKYVGWEWLKSDAGKDFEFKGKPVFEDDKIGIAIRKGDTKLRDRLNKALAEIRADGTYEKINAKYFPFSIY